MNIKIKKKQIIIELFGFITRSMIKKNTSNPLEIEVSLIEFERYINEKLGAQIHSVQHIYQQIRGYEREQRIRLFKKISSAKDDIALSLIRASDYRDKLFLHIGLKIAIANGSYDLLNHLYEHTYQPLNIYLSAGSESYYFAQHLFEESDREMNLYTHNLGIIENYINNYHHLSNIHLHTRFGIISSKELAIWERPVDNYAKITFNAIIGSTTAIDEHGLYIESEEEIEYKKDAFHVMKGVRILLLTLLEYNQPKDIPRYKYMEVKDFDYIVIPSEKLIPQYRDHLKNFPFEIYIKYYNYEVFKNINKPLVKPDLP